MGGLSCKEIEVRNEQGELCEGRQGSRIDKIGIQIHHSRKEREKIRGSHPGFQFDLGVSHCHTRQGMDL